MIYLVKETLWFPTNDHMGIYGVKKRIGAPVCRESSRAKHIGTLLHVTGRYLILESLTGESKGNYAWMKADDPCLKEISALEQLAEMAE